MSLRRYAAKRDTTERSIITALEQVGASVLQVDKFDLLIFYRGDLHMLECKSLTGKRAPKMAKQTASQVDLVKRGWPLVFVSTVEQALQAIGAVK